jgi:flagellar basal-body rod protein FlgB
MFGKSTEVQAMARALASHAAASQGVAARNIANADTPGYRAQQPQGFEQVYRDGAIMPMRATRAEHFGAQPGAGRRRLDVALHPAGGEQAPNGNNVSLEAEMMRAALARQQHDMALAVTRSLGGVIRSSLGRR